MTHILTEFPYTSDLVDKYIRSVVVYSPDLKIRFKAESPDSRAPLMAVSASRAVFDEGLLKIVSSIPGCTVKTGERVTEAEITREGVRIKTETGKSYSGSVLIGADSASSTVARILKMGLHDPGLEIDRETALGFALECDIDFGNFIPEGGTGKNGGEVILFLYFLEVPGYAWYFPRSTHANIGIGGPAVFGRKMREGFPKLIRILKELRRIPDRDYTELIKKGLRGAILPSTLPYPGIVRDRVILTGDAAGLCSPATGEGIYYAMKSGKIAAETIALLTEKYKKGNIPEEKRFSASDLILYRKRLMKSIGRELKFQYFVKNYVLMSGRRCAKAVRWGNRDAALRSLFASFLTGRISYKHIGLRLAYHYVRCKILDFFGKLGQPSEFEILHD